MNRIEHGGTADFDDALDELIVGVSGESGLYPVQKLAAHRMSTRHMAVSIFLFQGERVLLQQRASGKYHARLLWANSACSHPRWGEIAQACVDRTLLRQLGLALETEFVVQTHYAARVGMLYENEIVDCYRGTLPGDFACEEMNSNEVAAVCFMDVSAVCDDVAARPWAYAPWLRIYLETGVVGAMAY